MERPHKDGRPVEQHERQHSSLSDDKLMDEWDEELNNDGTSNRKTQNNRLSDVGMQEEYNPIPLPGRSFQDGGYTREMILTYDDWDRGLSKFERSRGYIEGGDYDWSEEEYNCFSQDVGPCRNDFGHIGPDKKDLRFERNWGEDGMDDNFAKQRERFRKYKRPPFFLPETLQRDFYSDTLTDLLQLDCP